RRARHNIRLAIFKYDGRRHGTKHSFAWYYRIGIAAQGAIHIGYTGLHTKIIHFIVQQKAGAAYYCLTAIASIESSGYGRGLAGGIIYAEVGRLLTFLDLTCLYYCTGTCLVGIIIFHTFLYIRIAYQGLYRHFEKVSISQELGAVGISTP